MHTDPVAASAPPQEGRRRGPGQGRHPVIWALLVLVMISIGLVIVVALQAREAQQSLQRAAERIPTLRSQLTSGDDEAAQATVAAFQQNTQDARDAVHGPHWSALGLLPWIGPNVDALQTVTEVVDDLGRQALPDLITAARAMNPERLAPVNGRIQLEPIREVQPEIVSANRAVVAAQDRMTTIDTEALIEQLRGPVTDLSASIDEVEGVTSIAAKAAQLLPAMLGGEEPRQYLLLVQNNAEPRALGGLVGAAILIRADDGEVTFLKQRSASLIGYPDQPVVRLSDAERSLYGTQLARFFGNVTSTPDFPRAAQLARTMWERTTGNRVDGVAAIDPVALQLILQATGPVTLPGGQRLTGQNTAQQLLNQVYIDHPNPQRQDAFFATAAATIFKHLMSGAGDLSGTTQALVKATERGRLLLWSAQPGEQSVLDGTAIAGQLRGKEGVHPLVGVYLHDRSAAKIGYYEDMDVTLRPTACRADGSKQLHLSLTLSSAVPGDGSKLPDYLTGGGNSVPIGQVRSQIAVYAPAGGLITEVGAQDGARPVVAQFHNGLHVAARAVTLEPGESVTLTYEIKSPASLPARPVLRLTPGPAPGRFSGETLRCP